MRLPTTRGALRLRAVEEAQGYRANKYVCRFFQRNYPGGFDSSMARPGSIATEMWGDRGVSSKGNAAVDPRAAHNSFKDSKNAREAACRRRRRILGAVLLLLLLGAAVSVNWGPLTDYLDARARLQKVSQEVAALEQQRLQLQAEVGKLTEASYLETLARKELSYARPGEELYIVVDSSSSDGAGEASPAATGARAVGLGPGEADVEVSGAQVEKVKVGFFERLVLALMDFFGGSERE
ncbi:MAG: septum formation initiator family protein [Thermoleophilia bacterium]|nr:septum formation initiator family protein [Thermoleophilia bacterium]